MLPAAGVAPMAPLAKARLDPRAHKKRSHPRHQPLSSRARASAGARSQTSIEQRGKMKLIEPHGGTLKIAYLPDEQVAQARQEALRYPSVDLNQRQLCDVKLLLNGAFSPLEGFLGQPDYDRVLADMRLADGTLWPIPVTLRRRRRDRRCARGRRRPRAARSGRLRDRGAARGVDLAAGPAAGGAGGVRHHRRQPSRRRPSAAPDQALLCRRQPVGHRAADRVRFQAVAR